MAQGVKHDPVQQIVAVATDVIEGNRGVIEGSRLLTALRFKVSRDGFDPDFMTFVAVDSETDHLPLGDVRKQWSSLALVEKDKEIEQAEAFHRSAVIESCERLIERFGKAV